MEPVSPLLQAQIEQQQIANQNQNNPSQYVDLTPKPDTFELKSALQETSDKTKWAKIAAIGAAIAALSAGIIYAVKKGKTIKLEDMNAEKFKKLQSDKFTGKVKGKLKNGDALVMEYSDGILQKSTRSGKVNFEKTYHTINNQKIVKTTANGVTSEFNITKTQQEAKEAQEKLKNILNDKNLSSTELQAQTDSIKFKSSAQKKEIQEAINTKKKAEADLEAKLEAQRKQRELERIAKEKAEQEAQQKALQEAEQKARLLKEQQIKEAEARLEKQIADFKTSLKNMPEDEMKKMAQNIQDEEIALWRKAQNLAEEKGIKSHAQIDILATLTKEEQEQYNILQRKLTAISSEQKLRSYVGLNNLIAKPADKPVKTAHSDSYATETERGELHTYYDDYRCNDAYRGNGSSVNINEGIMDGLFKKAPALEEEAVVYRSVSAPKASLNYDSRKKFIDSLVEGYTINDPAYVSTATKASDAQFYQFASGVASGQDEGVLMRIKLPKGTKGVLGGHNEYLLPRNSQIKINKINLIDGVKVADCEYILPN